MCEKIPIPAAGNKGCSTAAPNSPVGIAKFSNDDPLTSILMVGVCAKRSNDVKAGDTSPEKKIM